MVCKNMLYILLYIKCYIKSYLTPCEVVNNVSNMTGCVLGKDQWTTKPT